MNAAANDMKRWQARIFGTVWITYFAYYLCRYNMPIAKTPLCDTFGWDASDFGMIASALTVAYAVGQFVSGQLADRFGGRKIASIGVLGSVAANLCIYGALVARTSDGFSPRVTLAILVFLWGANGFFQAMGWSPMVRIMAHWFPSSTRGKVLGVLGTCYQLGAAFSWFLAFYIVSYHTANNAGDWRIVFLVPPLLFSVVGVLFVWLIRNAPEDVGLGTVEEEDKSESGLTATKHRTITQNVLRTLKNPYLWVVAATFFLLDLNRYGFVNWLPAYLDQHEVALGTGGFGLKTVMERIIHPLAGGVGAIAAGWATDRFFKGRRAPVIAILLLTLGVASIVFPFLPRSNAWMVIAALALIGFCTYGPHILMVGHAAQDFGKKSGAAGAAGFIDGMGYIGASVAGYGAGVLIEKFGYNINFVVFGFAAILGAVLICLIWTAGPKTRTVD